MPALLQRLWLPPRDCRISVSLGTMVNMTVFVMMVTPAADHFTTVTRLVFVNCIQQMCNLADRGAMELFDKSTDIPLATEEAKPAPVEKAPPTTTTTPANQRAPHHPSQQPHSDCIDLKVFSPLLPQYPHFCCTNLPHPTQHTPHPASPNANPVRLRASSVSTHTRAA